MLNQVEDAFSGLPYDPCHPRRDGRLYPPKAWHHGRMTARPDLRRYRFRTHTLYLSLCGAILIRHHYDGVILCKPGLDGGRVQLNPCLAHGKTERPG